MVSATVGSMPIASANAAASGAYWASALRARSPSFLVVSPLKSCEPPSTVWTGCRVPDSPGYCRANASCCAFRRSARSRSVFSERVVWAMVPLYQLRRTAASPRERFLTRCGMNRGMPPTKETDDPGLARSLSRARVALARTGPATRPSRRAKSSPGPAAMQFGLAALVLFVVAFATGHPKLIWLALALAAAGGLLFFSRHARGILGFAGYGPSDRAQIGMGASVASDAILEPGARVEMGADIGARALVRADAVLRAAPERVRECLGGSAETIASLRGTCEDLARRERELRAEASPSALQRLDEERAALEKRIAQAQDEQIRGSLGGALTAIAEQRKQRELLKLDPDRPDPERSRLLYTLEGLASQFVRMRTAGAQGRDPVDLERSVGQLRQELDAIADALDEVTKARPEMLLRELAEAPAMAEDGAGQSRARTRE